MMRCDANDFGYNHAITMRTAGGPTLTNSVSTVSLNSSDVFCYDETNLQTIVPR